MKKKRLLPLLALLTAGSMLILSGCSTDLTTINEEELSLEEEMEAQNLAEGMVMLHTVWTDVNGDDLAGVNVDFYNGDSNVYSGITEENGSLATFILPCNTELICSVTDSAGNTLAQAEIVIKLSDDFDGLSIYPPADTDDEDSIATCVLEIPSEKTNLRAAMFLTDSGIVSIANVTPYVEPETLPEEALEAEEADVAAEEAEDIEVEAEDIVEEENSDEDYSDEDYGGEENQEEEYYEDEDAGE